MNPRRPSDTILVLDAYDSFVWNLARMLEELGASPRVIRADALAVADVVGINPRAVLLSPGPMLPKDAGIFLDLTRNMGRNMPILGVCLGHQCLAEAHGAELAKAPPVHGHPWDIHHQHLGLFKGLPTPFRATRYHSIVVPRQSLPETLVELAWTMRDREPEHVMALAHRTLPHVGLQFHPESIGSEHGSQLLQTFLTAADAWWETETWKLGSPA